MRLSKRKRYVLKWNGPHCLTPKARRRNKAALGKGTKDQRDIAYFYECRYRGYAPSLSYLSDQMPSAKRRK